MLAAPLEHRLLVGEHQILEIAEAQRLAAPVGAGHGGDGIGEPVPLRPIEAGPQGVVPLGFVAQGAPLAAVVQAGNAGHTKQNAVHQGQMGGILQDGGGTGYVMVVGKAEQVLALVQRPLLRAVLPLEGVDDLKQVHGVQRGVQPFIALVVGAGMEHLAVDPLVIVAVEGFAH